MEDLTNDQLQDLDDMLASNDPDYVPSTKEMMDMIDSVDDEELRNNLRNLLSGGTPSLFGGYVAGTRLAIAFAVLIFSIILFFGYKLYRSIKDKEKKREEKKKLKQMKKKK